LRVSCWDQSLCRIGTRIWLPTEAEKAAQSRVLLCVRGAVCRETRMSRIVQIRGDRAVFPGNACVDCLRPASRDVEIVKVKRHTVRKVRVPFCDDCIALRRAKSRRQVLFEYAAIINSVLLAVAVGAWTYTSISSWQVLHSDRGWVWALLLALSLALSVFGLMYVIIRPWSRRFRSPETKAVLRAVTIKEFDWETTTLEFADKEYAERFAQVNEH